MMLSSLANALNSALALDPESKNRLHKLNGKSIGIELLPFHLQFQCSFSENGVTLHNSEILQTDTKLRGTPLQMLGVMLTKENRHRFFAEDILIEGNAEIGQQVINLFDHLQIDWEEQLSKLVGDIPAYHTSRLINKFKNAILDSGKNFCDQLNDYVHEEAKWLPSSEALHDFMSDIDALRMDVDRMEARINALIDKEENK